MKTVILCLICAVYCGTVFSDDDSCPDGEKRCIHAGENTYHSQCYDPKWSKCNSEGYLCSLDQESCDGECYSPGEKICADGTVCRKGQQVCKPNNPDDDPQCYNPSVHSCVYGKRRKLVMLGKKM